MDYQYVPKIGKTKLREVKAGDVIRVNIVDGVQVPVKVVSNDFLPDIRRHQLVLDNGEKNQYTVEQSFNDQRVYKRVKK